jgi:hypothetical protein
MAQEAGAGSLRTVDPPCHPRKVSVAGRKASGVWLASADERRPPRNTTGCSRTPLRPADVAAGSNRSVTTREAGESREAVVTNRARHGQRHLAATALTHPLPQARRTSGASSGIRLRGRGRCCSQSRGTDRSGPSQSLRRLLRPPLQTLPSTPTPLPRSERRDSDLRSRRSCRPDEFLDRKGHVRLAHLVEEALPSVLLGERGQSLNASKGEDKSAKIVLFGKCGAQPSSWDGLKPTYLLPLGKCKQRDLPEPTTERCANRFLR